MLTNTLVFLRVPTSQLQNNLQNTEVGYLSQGEVEYLRVTPQEQTKTDKTE
jgi:hypothetical protein